MPQFPAAATANEPTRRRNSTYLALACANAVSQGAMTRKVRQMFETPAGGSKNATPTTQRAPRRSEIAQAVQARRAAAAARRSTSLNPLVTEADKEPAANLVKSAASQSTSSLNTLAPNNNSSNNNNTSNVSTGSSSTSNNSSNNNSPAVIRCDKCSSILSPPQSPTPPALAIEPDAEALSKPQTEAEKGAAPADGADDPAAEQKKLSKIPSNREVLAEELPKPDTVKNARCLFETNLIGAADASAIDAYATLRIQHVKSNPSSKILRSESSAATMGLSVRAGAGHLSPAKLSTPAAKIGDEEVVTAEDKAYVITVGRLNSMRWPSRKEHAVRSPSPPANRPERDFYGHGLLPSSGSKSQHMYRSNPSLYQRSRSGGRIGRSSSTSRRSTDVESVVSEASDWSSDLESEISFGGSSSASSAFSNNQEASEARYISPEVLDKIRSYGMTLVFVDGKMVDQSAPTDAEEVDGVETIRSAGQSGHGRTSRTLETVNNINNSGTFNPAAKDAAKRSPRIVGCLPKQSIERMRHNSADSASSGISSATNDSQTSPFASLKRTTVAPADDDAERTRSPSPGPTQHPANVKSITSSPFGTYSVVYNFQQSRTPMFV